MNKTESLCRLSTCCLGALLPAVLTINTGCVANKPLQIKRVGMVVGIDPNQIEEYKRLHADGNPGVRDTLSKYHM